MASSAPDHLRTPGLISNRPCYEGINVELEGDNGLYLMLAHSKISDAGFYFGLQTDVHAPEPPYGRGKGLLLSRWETRDLANARFSETDG